MTVKATMIRAKQKAIAAEPFSLIFRCIASAPNRSRQCRAYRCYEDRLWVMGALKRLALRRHLEWLPPHGQDEQSYTSAFQFQVLIPFTRFSLYEFLPSGCAGVANQTSAKRYRLAAGCSLYQTRGG